VNRVVGALAVCLLILGIALVTLVAVRQPFAFGDYVGIWGLKGRALARSGDLTALFRVDPSGSFSHPEYPPLWSAVLAAWSSVVGGWDDLLVTPAWPLVCLGGSLAAVRLARGPWPFRLLAGAAVSLLPFYRDYPGYAEALLAVFVLLALAEADRLEVSRLAALRLAAFLVLAAWTKQEGGLVGLVVAAVLLATRRIRAGLLAATSTFLLGILPWQLFVRWGDPETPQRAYSLASFSPASLVAAAGVVLREGVLPNAGWLLGAALLLALAPATRARRRPVLAGAALYAGCLLLSFLFSYFPAAWMMYWSWDRLAFVPVAVLLPILAEATVEATGGG